MAAASLLRALFKLLLLTVGQDGFHLLMAIRHRGPYLLATLVGAQCRIALNRVPLLLLVLQDRQYLLLLVRCQIQLLG
jgi:hypothetical protein